jgi:hypothetical protein
VAVAAAAVVVVAAAVVDAVTNHQYKQEFLYTFPLI